MKTYRILLAATLVSASWAAAAKPTCAQDAVNLLAEGNAAALAAKFKQPKAVLPRLQALSATAGRLSDLSQTNEPRFKEHQRISIGKPDARYSGAWVNATSDRLGAVQFHVAMSPGASCELQALHLDYTK